MPWNSCEEEERPILSGKMQFIKSFEMNNAYGP